MKLPIGWKELPLRDLLSQPISGVSVLADDEAPPPGEPGVLRLSCVTDGRFDPRDLKTPQHGQATRLGVAAEDDTILISRSNTPNLVGESAYVSGNHPFAFLPDTLWLLKSKQGVEVSMPWLGYMLRSNHYRRMLQRIASGTSQSMKKIQKGALLGLHAATPPVPEQCKIADILAAWDEALEKLDDLIAANDSRRKALTHQLLFGKRRFNQFKKPWRAFRLGSLLEPSDRYITWDDARTVRLAGVRRNGGGVFARGELPAGEIKVKTAKIIREGDFLISRRQITWGGMALVPAEFDGYEVNDEYEVLVSKDPDRLSIEFFACLAHTKYLKHLAYLASNGVFAERLRLNFNLPAFLKSEIYLPTDVGEQRAIVDFINTLVDELNLLRRQRDALDLQKRGLMQRLLTGKIRVRTKPVETT